MRAVIIDAPGSIRVDSLADPVPREGEVLVRVGACGICGTDLHIIDGDSPLARYPIIPGHEFAGEVVAFGDGGEQESGRSGGLKIGSRVAVDPNLACGHCEFCRTGHENLCVTYTAVGVTVPGAIAEYITVPIKKVYTLPDNISLREAALIEPVSCAVHGMHCLSPRSGDTFLIVGAGTMGLMLLQLALRGGASRVAVVDINAKRLERAEGYGATSTYRDIQEALKDEPSGFNCVIDATGVPSVIERAFMTVKRGGKFMIFGVAPAESQISLSPFRIYNDEITIVGSMAVLFSFQAAIDLISGGVIHAESMITSAFALDEFPRALEAVRSGQGIKTQILLNA